MVFQLLGSFSWVVSHIKAGFIAFNLSCSVLHGNASTFLLHCDYIDWNICNWVFQWVKNWRIIIVIIRRRHFIFDHLILHWVRVWEMEVQSKDIPFNWFYWVLVNLHRFLHMPTKFGFTWLININMRPHFSLVSLENQKIEWKYAQVMCNLYVLCINLH